PIDHPVAALVDERLHVDPAAALPRAIEAPVMQAIEIGEDAVLICEHYERSSCCAVITCITSPRKAGRGRDRLRSDGTVRGPLIASDSISHLRLFAWVPDNKRYLACPSPSRRCAPGPSLSPLRGARCADEQVAAICLILAAVSRRRPCRDASPWQASLPACFLHRAQAGP